MRSPFSRDKPSEDAVPERRKKRTTQDMLDERKGPGFFGTALRTLAGLALVVAAGAAIFFGASALEGDDKVVLAPWNDASAPSVRPAPLNDQ